MSRAPHAGPPFPAEPEELPPLEPAVEAELVEALRSAWDPPPLDPARHRRILEAALEDPFAAPSEDEVRESARLRRALEGEDASHPDVELARALRSAVKPHDPRPGAATVPKRAPGTAARVVTVTFGAVALAAAASFALSISLRQSEPVAVSKSAASKPVGPIQSRTTGELFSERFKTGGTTERIDRIALAREQDLRNNLYAKWGVP